MKIITFRCDLCEYEKTMDIPVGMQVPRVLWQMGRYEVCDLCSEKIKQLIEKNFKKNENTNSHSE